MLFCLALVLCGKFGAGLKNDALVAFNCLSSRSPIAVHRNTPTYSFHEEREPISLSLYLSVCLAVHNQHRVFSVRYSAQYVLEHCAATGLAFTAGCDGKILSFAIDTAIDADAQSVVVTAKPVGALRRHTDFVQVSENKQPRGLFTAALSCAIET